MSRNQAFDVVVAGAGAAGLMCAIRAGQRGRRVLLLDHAEKVGKKILISGGGRCNFTNTDSRPEAFLSANPHFCKSALARYTQHDFIALVEKHGIAWHEKTLGQLFCDGSARQIVAMLLEECAAVGVDVRVAHRITNIEKSDRFSVRTDHGDFDAESVVLATGGIGKSFKVSSNSWEYSGDGHALALRAGSSLINMEFVQFHPTGMVWPLSVKGILVTEGVRGDGGVLKNANGERFMFNYIPPVFKGQYAETEAEADQWMVDNDSARRTPDLLPRDEVSHAINAEVKAGRGSPHGGVYLDIASRMPAEEIKRRLPSMYHQFIELAEVDITTEPMEVGPTCHYVMGGIEVDRDTGAAATLGLFAAGECSGGMHGSNRLGGNSLSDLLVFGRRAGLGAADYVRALSIRPSVTQEALDSAAALALAPFTGPQGQAKPENPYALHAELQQTMNDLVGIIRTGSEIEDALSKIEEYKLRFRNIESEGGRAFNPGWHLALDMRNMLLVSECVAKASLARTESRGGHTRDDHPKMDSQWRRTLLVCSTSDDRTSDDAVVPEVSVTKQQQPPMREDLLAQFDIEELGKYYTDEELAAHPGRMEERR